MSKRCSDSESETDSEPENKKLKINLTESFDLENIDETEDLELEIEREFVEIKHKVNCLKDLIEIGKLYDPFKDYNIDVEILYRLIEPLTDLDNMVGMNDIKEDMTDHILFRIQRFDMYNQMMMHTVIEGPPGTGKTEVAKIIGRIYLAMGILKNNKFIKATRSQLIAGYLGQTAIATQKMIDKSIGGILFIDEVYSLGNIEKRDSFSKECIDTLNENLTSKKTDFICIIAGYKDDIKDCFFAYNDGLERRFPIRFHIEEYSSNELYSIFQKKVIENGWKLDEIEPSFFEERHSKFRFFGGDMEILFNNCKRCHSRRIFETGDEKKVLKKIDLERGYETFINHKREKIVKESDSWKNMYL